MPIYEFYCQKCHTIFNFLSKRVDTETCPNCPKCKKPLQREISMFAMTGNASEDDMSDDLPINESKMERAMEALASDVEGLNEEDPRQAAKLMRKFSDMTGMEFGKSMQEAIGRMEAGEDPESIEAELGGQIEQEEPFVLTGKGGGVGSTKRRSAPTRDETLYEM